MKRFLALCLIIFLSITLSAQKRILRFTPENFQRAESILKSIDIAGANIYSYYDIIVEEKDMFAVMQAGISFKFVDMPDAKATFIDLDSVYNWVSSLHALYPSITDVDTIGFTPVEANPIVALKINGNDPVSQGGREAFLLMGNHHAREWQTVYVPLFYADSILHAYGSVPEITSMIDNVFIVIVPTVNPDGYDYSRNFDNMWRKNRSYRDGYYGVDLNRNYNGSYNYDYQADWGFIGNDYTTHYPTSDVYCGPYAGSEAEVQLVQALIRTYDFDISLSLHSYGEMLMWPWGAVTYAAPDSALLIYLGTEAASRMRKQDGFTTYDAVQSCGLYPVTGDSEDWIYGYSKYVLGNTVMSYIAEIDISFNSDVAGLDSLCRRLFPGMLYMNLFSESLSTANEVPLKPALSFSNDTLTWTGTNMNNADYFTVYNYNSPSNVIDSLCDSMLFNVDGFESAIVTTESGGVSWHSQNLEYTTRILGYRNKLFINTGDSLKVRITCDLEENYDVAFLEVSRNGNEYSIIDTVNGKFTGFVPYTDFSYPLEDYEGEEIYIRFKVVFDGNTFGSGFYADNIFPVQSFNTDSVFIASTTDTFAAFDFSSYSGDYFAVHPHHPSTYTQISDRLLYLSTALSGSFLSYIVKEGYIKFLFNSYEEAVYSIFRKSGSDYKLIGTTRQSYFIDDNVSIGNNEYRIDVYSLNGVKIKTGYLEIPFYDNAVHAIESMPSVFLNACNANDAILNIGNIKTYDKTGRELKHIEKPGIYFIILQPKALIKRITVL